MYYQYCKLSSQNYCNLCYVNFEFYHVIRIMIYWYLLVPVNRYTYNILYGRMQNFIILFNKFFFRNCSKNYVIHLLLGWVRNTTSNIICHSSSQFLIKNHYLIKDWDQKWKIIKLVIQISPNQQKISQKILPFEKISFTKSSIY